MNTEEKGIFAVGLFLGLFVGIILTHFCYQIGFSEILSHEKIKPDYTIKIHGDKIDTTFHYHN